MNQKTAVVAVTESWTALDTSYTELSLVVARDRNGRVNKIELEPQAATYARVLPAGEGFVVLWGRLVSLQPFNIAQFITLLDADGTWRYSSPGGFRMLGWPEGYDPDGGIFSLVHPDDVETAARAFSEVRSGARSSFEPVVFRVRHVDGHYVFLETTGQNLIDDPAVNGILLVSRDVTERLRDQEALATARDAALAALQA